MITSWLRFSFVLFSILLSSALSAYEPLTSDEYLENRLMIDTAISPNGDYLATVWYVDKTNRNIVTIQDLNQPSRPIIATINERITLPQKIYWASNERIIMQLTAPIFLNDAKSDLKKDPDNFNIFHYKTHLVTVSVNHLGKDLVTLKSGRNGKSLNQIRDFMLYDADHILMERRHNGRKELHKVNILTGKGEVISTGGKDTIKFIPDEKGEPKYRVDYLKVSKAFEIFELIDDDWQSIEKVRLRSLSDELEGGYDDHDTDLIGINNNKINYLKANEKTGYKEIVSIDTKTKKAKVLISLAGKDVIDIIQNRRSSAISAYIYAEKDVKRTVYFDPKRQSINEKLASYFAYESYQVFVFSDDYRKSMIKVNGSNERAFYLYDDETGEIELYSHIYKKLIPENLGTPARVSYNARDKLKIRSYLLLPPGYKKGTLYPLVVVPHGGPLSRDYAQFDHLAQFLSTRGYIVIQPNFRGSSGYGDDFKEMGYKQWGGVMQDDLEDAVHFLVDKGYADKNKVCILGGSYGGYAALMGLVKTPDLYQCAVSVNGVTDLASMIKHKNKTFKNRKPILDYIQRAYGDLEHDSEYLAHNSPLLRSDKISKPVLLLVGEKDNVVSAEQSMDLYHVLEEGNKVVEGYSAKWSGHNLFYYSNCRKESYKKIEAFLAKHLDVPIIKKPNETQTKKKGFWDKEDKPCLTQI